MFVLFATKSLNDGTSGFRFNFCGIKGVYRYRQNLNRCKHTFGIVRKDCTKAIFLGKLALYIEQKKNKTTGRRIRHFAG